MRLERLAPRDAVSLTDATLTPYRAVRRAMTAITPEAPVLVIGVGGLGEVLALAERGDLTLIEQEVLPLERIGEAYRRLKSGEFARRVVVTP